MERNTLAVEAMAQHVSTLAKQVGKFDSALTLLVQDRKETHQEIGMLKRRLERISDLFPVLSTPDPEPIGG